MGQTHVRRWPRDQIINIRTNQAQREMIDRAARLVGKSRSEFMLDVATRAAEDVLLDRVFLRLDPESFDRFVALLDEAPPPTEALRALLARPAPWE